MITAKMSLKSLKFPLLMAESNMILSKTATIFIVAFVLLAHTISPSTANAEERTFETITEALNYNGNRNAVTKLIITGTIQGNNYSESSE